LANVGLGFAAIESVSQARPGYWRGSRQTGASLSFYFSWTWHRDEPEILSGLPLKRLRLGSTAIRTKAKAVRFHRAQLNHPSGEPILPDYLLGPIWWPFEVFAGE
jgi:hypothetical protein